VGYLTDREVGKEYGCRIKVNHWKRQGALVLADNHRLVGVCFETLRWRYRLAGPSQNQWIQLQNEVIIVERVRENGLKTG